MSRPAGYVGLCVVAALACAPAYAEPPDFRRDVAPILSRAGCNQGACHGNQNGKCGVKLSLRGETPDFDFVALTRDGQGRDETLAMVDAAAYAAKAAGRNCYCVSTDASVDETRARLDLEVSLRQGLDENELELHYQPIVTTDGSEVIGVEALVRWRSPKRGMLSPQQFVPIAEETGLIVPMGRWVLEEACRKLREWTLAHPERKPLSVSVNLSALQFAQHRLPEDVAATLEATGLPAS